MEIPLSTLVSAATMGAAMRCSTTYTQLLWSAPLGGAPSQRHGQGYRKPDDDGRGNTLDAFTSSAPSARLDSELARCTGLAFYLRHVPSAPAQHAYMIVGRTRIVVCKPATAPRTKLSTNKSTQRPRHPPFLEGLIAAGGAPLRGIRCHHYHVRRSRAC